MVVPGQTEEQADRKGVDKERLVDHRKCCSVILCTNCDVCPTAPPSVLFMIDCVRLGEIGDNRNMQMGWIPSHSGKDTATRSRQPVEKIETRLDRR